MVETINNILLNVDRISSDCYEWSFITEDGEEKSGYTDTFQAAHSAGDTEIFLYNEEQQLFNVDNSDLESLIN